MSYIFFTSGFEHFDCDTPRERENGADTGGGETRIYQIEFPTKGRDKGMPSGGLPRKGWDTDGNEDALLLPACLGHLDHLGGRKPPTHKVLMMRYAGPVAGPQWETS